MPGGLSTKKVRVLYFWAIQVSTMCFEPFGQESKPVDWVVFQTISICVEQLLQGGVIQLASFVLVCNSQMDKNRRTRASIEQPAIHCQDLRWPNRCSSKCSSPARSREEAGIISQDLRGDRVRLHLNRFHLAPPHVRFGCVTSRHLDLTLPLGTGEPDVVLRTEGVADLRDAL